MQTSFNFKMWGSWLCAFSTKFWKSWATSEFESSKDRVKSKLNRKSTQKETVRNELFTIALGFKPAAYGSLMLCYLSWHWSSKMLWFEGILKDMEVAKGSLFWFPSTQGRRNERAGGHPKKRETAKKRSAGAVDYQNWSKIAHKKGKIQPLGTNTARESYLQH